MGSFTFTGNAPFGAPHDTVDVETGNDAITLIHHGPVDASRRGTGHTGQVQSWTFELKGSMILSFNKELIKPAARPAEKPGLLGKLFGAGSAPAPVAPAQARCTINIEVRSRPCVVVLTGAPHDVEDLNHALVLMRSKEKKQRIMQI